MADAQGTAKVSALSRARGQVVRVAIPARVAFNLEAFQKTVSELARELGCERCISGAHCLFANIADYVVNPEGGLDPQPEPWAGSLDRQFGF